jgi:hypothetical protein
MNLCGKWLSQTYHCIFELVIPEAIDKNTGCCAWNVHLIAVSFHWQLT